MHRQPAIYLLAITVILLGLLSFGCMEAASDYDTLYFSEERIHVPEDFSKEPGGDAEDHSEEPDPESDDAGNPSNTKDTEDRTSSEETDVPASPTKEETSHTQENASTKTTSAPPAQQISTEDTETTGKSNGNQAQTTAAPEETTAAPATTQAPEETTKAAEVTTEAPAETTVALTPISVVPAYDTPRTSSWNTNIRIDSVRIENTLNADNTYKVKVYMSVTNMSSSVQIVSAMSRLSGQDPDSGVHAYLYGGQSGETSATFNSVPGGYYTLTF